MNYRHLYIFCLAMCLCAGASSSALAKDKIPCVEKDEKGRWILNKRRFCIQYTVPEERWTQKKLTRLLEYIQKKEPMWLKNEKAYIRIVSSFEQSKQGYLQQIEQYKKTIASKEREARIWQDTFMKLQAMRQPPSKKVWENPWFWTTVAIVITIGVVASVAISEKLGSSSSALVKQQSSLFVKSPIPATSYRRAIHGRVGFVIHP